MKLAVQKNHFGVQMQIKNGGLATKNIFRPLIF